MDITTHSQKGIANAQLIPAPRDPDCWSGDVRAGGKFRGVFFGVDVNINIRALGHESLGLAESLALSVGYVNPGTFNSKGFNDDNQNVFRESRIQNSLLKGRCQGDVATVEEVESQRGQRME